MTFLQSISDTLAAENKSVNSDTALIACLLDAHDIDVVTPVKKGIEIWNLPHAGVSHYVAALLGDHGLAMTASIHNAKPGEFCLYQQDVRLGKSDYLDLAVTPACVALLTSPAGGINEPRLIPSIKRTVVLTWSPRTLELFCAWTWPKAPAYDWSWLAGVSYDFKDFLFAARAAGGPAHMARIVRETATGLLVDQHHDHDFWGADATARPLATLASGVVRKLSEMTGFGDAQAWGMTLAQELRDYASGELDWADVDKGILLSSPPGGGKTTFARALAAEVGDDVHFEAITYATFEGSSYVVKAMAKKFAEWRKIAAQGKCVIVFWDEIDSMGARGGNAHNESYWGAIINTLLAFLDGAEPRDGIVMIAATNYPDRVDPALRRPGRLDQHVRLPAPGVEALAAMIALHLKVDANAPETLVGARAMRGRSPAELEQWCRATRRMGRLLKRDVDGEDLADVVRYSQRIRSPQEDRLTAIHEAGHALVVLRLGHDVVLQAEIDGEGDRDGGVAFGLRKGASTMPVVVKRIAGILGGRAAEQVVCGQVTSGARQDLAQATKMAHAALYEWGLGPRLFSVEQMPTTDAMVVEIEELLQQGYMVAVEIATKDRRLVEALADELIEKRCMEGREIVAFVKAFADRRRGRFLSQKIVDREYPVPANLAFAA